ncbi:MAG: NADH-quinone oxidoreductase subunit M, partial [Chloroflexota bacterium]|nr:NADH-quinone oxidoreductase subunit M [Chloroflexota bacterium]
MDFGGFPILSAIVFTPLIGALLIALVPRERDDLVRWLALGTALVAFALSLAVAAAFTAAQPGFQYVETADWIPAFGIQYKLGLDGLSLLLVVLTTTLTAISLLASFGPIKTRVKEYMIAFLVLEVGL